MNNYPIAPEQRHIMHPYKRTTICGLIFQTFPVVHSIRCPGVGYRISFGKKNIFCVHDLISLDDRATALAECCLYIGDGASITRPLVRRKGTQLFGHTTIRAQLGWCQKEGIPRAIFTHCGSQIVQSDGRTINAQVQRLGRERDVQAKIAYDGMEIEV
jgi:phosphoribosyl 1,2-cyclic phosphodiesterase